MLLIPEKTFHMYTACSEDVEHTAFMVESHAPEVCADQQPVELLAFFMDDTIRTDEDIERYLNLTVIGDIPDGNGSKRKNYKYRYAYIQNADTSDDSAKEE